MQKEKVVEEESSPHKLGQFRSVNPAGEAQAAGAPTADAQGHEGEDVGEEAR
jgi:hypothetical protein